MFDRIKKKIKNIFSKMIKHSKRDRVVFTKSKNYENEDRENEDRENLINDLDNSYNKINKKIVDSIKEYDELNFNQTDTIQIKLDPTIKTKNEIIKEELEKDYTKNVEKVLQNKIHRKDRHKRYK